MAYGSHSQAKVYEARVIALESEITSRDATIAKLRWTVTELEQGCLDFESDLSRDKAEVLWHLSEYRISLSKR